MGFRVIVTGVRHFHDYARLRDLLDHLLRNRLPDVVILSRCGRGTDALATSYALERGRSCASLEPAVGVVVGRAGAPEVRVQAIVPRPAAAPALPRSRRRV